MTLLNTAWNLHRIVYIVHGVSRGHRRHLVLLVLLVLAIFIFWKQ
jgi:hypothetical protein